MQEESTKEELQARVVLSQSEIVYTRSLVDLMSVQLATAMEQICYYKSMLDGASRAEGSPEDMLSAQLQRAREVSLLQCSSHHTHFCASHALTLGLYLLAWSG